MERETELFAVGVKGGIKSDLHNTAQKALEQRHVPVELRLGSTVTAVYPERAEFQRHDQTESVSAATVVWTAGTTTNPVIKDLPVPEEHSDKHDHLHVTPTL